MHQSFLTTGSAAAAIVRSHAAAFGSALLDVLYPRLCIGCDRLLAEERSPICVRCLLQLERTSPDTIDAALGRLPVDGGSPISHGFTLWTFDKGGVVQKVQHALKYGNMPIIGHTMGWLLGNAFEEERDRQPAWPTPDVLMPIPLSRMRQLERGYNQSTQLAEGMATAMSVPVQDQVLHRTRVTATQTKLSHLGRWQNVLGAFAVAVPEAVIERHVLLVDDLLTTGATLAAAALALQGAGAASVGATALAFARPG